LLNASQFHERFALGSLRVESGPDFLFFGKLEVRAQFRVHLFIDVFLADEIAPEVDEATPGHGSIENLYEEYSGDL
jgi:hypothetical protein